MNKKDLYIPVNVVERNDIVSGFGKTELMITVISFLIAVCIGIWIIVSSEKIATAIFLGAMLIAVTIFLIRRDKFDESVIDKLFIIKKYYKSQKRYIYHYHNIYEGEPYETKDRTGHQNTDGK